MIKGFLGSNSGGGFVSYFNELVPKGGRLVILKGGSGSGKSTLMKKAAEFANTLKMDAEFYYCSSDPNSLDGVYIPKLSFGVCDGTSPHIVEPYAYGAGSEIVNMGDAVKGDLRAKFSELDTLIKKKAACYKSAYRYLAAAQLVADDLSTSYCTQIKEESLARFAAQIIENVGGENGAGCVRKMFISAITPFGFCDYAGCLQSAKKIIVLGGADECIYSRIMSEMLKVVGGAINVYLNPLRPQLLDALYFYGCDVAVISKTFLRPELVGEFIDLSPLAKDVNEEFKINAEQQQQRLLSIGSSVMKSAYDNHQLIENIYRPFVDFERVNAKISQVITIMQS